MAKVQNDEKVVAKRKEVKRKPHKPMSTEIGAMLSPETLRALRKLGSKGKR